MERDMLSIGLSESRKDYLRTRWRQNETDYLREQRRKVDVSAFVKLKTIGHGEYASVSSHPFAHPSRLMSGAFGVVSLVKERATGKLFAMKQVRVLLAKPSITLIAVYAYPVAQDGHVEEGSRGSRSRRA